MEQNENMKKLIEKKIEQKIERKLKRTIPKVFKIFFMILMGILFAFLVGYVVMRLWNWLLPDLFGLTMITYWQAVGILLLAKLFFGFGNHSSYNKKDKFKRKFKAKKCYPLRKDFSEWEHYDEFWKEEGETAFKAYVERNKKEE